MESAGGRTALNRLSRLSFALGDSPGLSRTSPASAELAPAPAPQSRRRLADAIEEAFQIALSRGDLATAEELLAVWQGTRERARVRTARDRRLADPKIERARQALETRKATRYRRY